MTGWLLIGLAPPNCARPADCPKHARLNAPPGIGLAIEIANIAQLDSEDDTAALAQLQHEILCRYILISDVVPIALGAAFSSLAAIEEYLSQDGRELAVLCDRLAGRVEYTVAVSRTAPQKDAVARDSASGAAHLRARMSRRNQTRQRRDHAQAEIVKLSRRFSQYCEGQRLRQAQRNDRLATFDVLMRRDDVDACLDMLADTALELADEGLKLSATGPCPAFSFLKEEENA